MQLLGWEAVPASGDEFREVADEREARHVASEREAKARAAELVTSRPPTLSDLLRQAERAEIPELNLVVKADVQGSLGALTDAFLKLPQDEVRVNIVRSAAGGDHRERRLPRDGVGRDRDRASTCDPTSRPSTSPRRKASTSAPTA